MPYSRFCPLGVGNEISMVAFKLPPSRFLIGEIKRALEAAVDAGEIEGRLEAAAYVEFVGQHREALRLALIHLSEREFIRLRTRSERRMVSCTITRVSSGRARLDALQHNQ